MHHGQVVPGLGETKGPAPGQTKPLCGLDFAYPCAMLFMCITSGICLNVLRIRAYDLSGPDDCLPGILKIKRCRKH